VKANHVRIFFFIFLFDNKKSLMENVQSRPHFCGFLFVVYTFVCVNNQTKYFSTNKK